MSDKRIVFVREGLTVSTGLSSVERVLQLDGYVGVATTDQSLLMLRVDSSARLFLEGTVLGVLAKHQGGERYKALLQALRARARL